MTLEPAETEAATESSWVDAVADEPNELGQAILAQGERLYEATVRANETRAAQDAATDKRLDEVEKGAAARDEKLVGIKEQLSDIKTRLDRPSGFERAFEATAAGIGKFLDNKTAVVVALGIFAAVVFGLSIETPLGSIGTGDDDTATPLAQDDDDGGTDSRDADGMAFPVE